MAGAVPPPIDFDGAFEDVAFDPSVEENEEYKLIHTAIRTEGWGTMKFATSDSQMLTLTKKVCTIVAAQNQDTRRHLMPNNANTEARKTWVNDHQKKVQTALCRVRQYVNSNVHGVIRENLTSNLALPDPRVIENIIFRRIDITKRDDDSETAVWWYTKICPQLTACKDHFSSDKYLYKMISLCNHDYRGTPTQDLTVEHEVFGLLIYENNIDRWRKLQEHRRNNPGKKVLVYKNNLLPDGTARVQKPNEKHVYSDTDVNLRPKWSKPDAGRGTFGGWSQEAYKRYANLRVDCHAARTAMSVEQKLRWEMDLLIVIRETLGIEGHTAEEQRQLDGKGAPKAVMPEIQGVFDDESMRYLSGRGTFNQASYDEASAFLAQELTNVTNARREAEELRNRREQEAAELAEKEESERKKRRLDEESTARQVQLQRIRDLQADLDERQKELDKREKRLKQKYGKIKRSSNKPQAGRGGSSGSSGSMEENRG